MKKIILCAAFLSALVSCEKDEDCKKSERCDLVPDPGMCKAYFPKYYFDKTESKCKGIYLGWLQWGSAFQHVGRMQTV